MEIEMKKFFDKDRNPTSLAWIALLRMMLGVLFLTTWGSNVSKGLYTPDGLQFFFTEVFPQSANSLTWYAAFINNVILPIRVFFGPFQLIGEFIFGFFLLIGLFTPHSAFVAGFFIINTFLATYGHDWPWSYAMILGVLFVVFMTKAGRSLGVDTWLHKTRGEPKIPFLW
jgi:uncharacterized membrane protein YphA (DoxX/SURF4 family)